MERLFEKYEPDAAHNFEYLPGSLRTKTAGTYRIFKNSGTWGESKTRLTIPVKQQNAGAYVMTRGPNTFSFKIPRGGIRAKEANLLPRGGNILRVVASEGDGTAPVRGDAAGYIETLPEHYNNGGHGGGGFGGRAGVGDAHENNDEHGYERHIPTGQPIQFVKKEKTNDIIEKFTEPITEHTAKVEKTISGNVGKQTTDDGNHGPAPLPPGYAGTNPAVPRVNTAAKNEKHRLSVKDKKAKAKEPDNDNAHAALVDQMRNIQLLPKPDEVMLDKVLLDLKDYKKTVSVEEQSTHKLGTSTLRPGKDVDDADQHVLANAKRIKSAFAKMTAEQRGAAIVTVIAAIRTECLKYAGNISKAGALFKKYFPLIAELEELYPEVHERMKDFLKKGAKRTETAKQPEWTGKRRRVGPAPYDDVGAVVKRK